MTQLQEVPPRSFILLVGPPGSGKSTFLYRSILQNLEIDRPIIYVTTEYGPFDAERALKEQGLTEVEPGLLNYVGAAMAHMLPASLAGTFKGFESWRGIEREWNAVETKCIGLGDPHCEYKLIPGEIEELKPSLEKDISILEKIHDRLTQHLMGFLLNEKPLVERPGLGSDAGMSGVFHVMVHAALAGERYRMAMRMGASKAGKEVGEHLMQAGVSEDEAVNRVLHLLDYCKVGRVTADETIRMNESCESVWVKFRAKRWEEPRCYFTTGFVNGFFSAVKNKHVKETKCIGMGDPYCEWEFT